ncbi:MAG: protein phosphatase 2C family protein [Bacteriovoracaceae bacterium]|nr:protein phosphatase 2C family protein [Bacteriovoracaceae bacterium]
MPFKTNISLLISGEGPIQSEVFDWGEYRIGYYLEMNREKTTKNEDVLFIHGNEKGLVFGVSDGAGGHPKGHKAAKIVGQKVSEYFHHKDFDKRNMLNLIEKINDEVISLKVGARCTLAMTTIEDNQMRSFSVGDSEIIYWNALGNEIYSNIPHSEVGYRVEAGDVEQKESLDDPNRNIVNNLVGDSTIRIESASKMLMKKGHTILIGTDGVFDNISHESLRELVATGPFKKSFEDLYKYCKEQNPETWKKNDDIGFTLLRKIKS